MSIEFRKIGIRRYIYATFAIIIISTNALGNSNREQIYTSPIAIGPFQNLSGSDDSAHWQFTIPTLWKLRINTIASIRLLPDSSVRFAFAESQQSFDKELTLPTALKIGEILEAKWMLYGSYIQLTNICKLNVKLLNLGSGELKEFSDVSSNWLQVVAETEKQIAFQLGTTLDTPAEKQAEYPSRRNPMALEFFSQGSYHLRMGEPLVRAEKSFKDALDTDNHFALAAMSLAYTLMLEGKLEEASVTARLSTNLAPRFHASHYILGSTYAANGLNNLAKMEFQEAIRLEPYDINSYVKLSYVSAGNENWRESLSVLKTAAKFAPYDSLVHAEIARACCHLQLRPEALIELGLTERYRGVEPGIEHTMGEAYRLLNDLPRAILHYTTFVTNAQSIGLQSPLIATDAVLLADLKERLQPIAVEAVKPRSFTANELDLVLKEKLRPKELHFARNPLTSTHAMAGLAAKWTEGAADDLEKGRKLFNQLCTRINIVDDPRPRTAEEAFALWLKSDGGMTCQDYALLFTSMARTVGLNAYFVLVETDYSGKTVYHACAAVFIHDKSYLVDPAYAWFGVPHKQFQIENDLQVIAVYLCQSLDSAVGQLGLKLAPNWPDLRFNFAIELINSDHLKQAEEVIGIQKESDSNSWRAFFARGFLYGAKKRWDLAVENLRNAVFLRSNFSLSHYLLATALYNQGNFIEARSEYRIYLGLESSSSLIQNARAAIISIDESMRQAPNFNLRYESE